MTFKRSFWTILTVSVAVLAVAYLFGIPQEYLVFGGFLLVASGVLFLATNDLFDKYYKEKGIKEKKLLSVKYLIGFLIILVSVAILIWALKYEDNLKFFLTLGLGVFSGVLGGRWFHTSYRKSLLEPEIKITERWNRDKKKLAKAKTPETAAKVLGKSLRYHLVGNDPFGDLNFNAPLGEVDNVSLTHDEMKDDQMAGLASDYIQILVDNLDLKEVISEGGE